VLELYTDVLRSEKENGFIIALLKLSNENLFPALRSFLI